MKTDSGRSRLDEHYRQLGAILDRAEGELRRGRHEDAAVLAQVAATFAWRNHAGVFASERLEGVLGVVARTLVSSSSTSTTVPRRTRPASVLHVATQVYGTGGHTQMLSNWIRQDRCHTHALALVAQDDRPVPTKLLEALGGRDPVLLDDDPDTLLGRARRLRVAAGEVETVVLHVHPHDVVPALAFAGDDEGPTVWYVNHADHVFWAGAAAVHRVVNLRESGARLNLERRGIDPVHHALLTRPLTMRDREHDRSEAKRRLGLPADSLVVASAADRTKYEPVEGIGFLDVLEPLLDRRDDVRLLVAGPPPEGRWSELERRGRGRALGLLPDIRPLLEAADVYVDSYPFSSLTSMLEAACFGVPVASLRPPSAEPRVLGADTPELDDVLVLGESPQQLCERLDSLLVDPRRRAELGSATRASMERSHGGDAWAEEAAKLLDTPDAAQAGRVSVRGTRRTGELDQRVGRVQAQTGLAGLDGALLVNVGLLRAGDRLALAVRRARGGHSPTLPELLSTRWTRRVRAARRGGSWRA